DEYMRMVENEEVESCREQKQLMDFLKWKLDQPNVVIDHEAINNSVDKPAPYFDFELYPWQRFCNAFIYGVRYDDGRLMFNRFYMMTGHHGVQNYDIDIVATAEKQAKTSSEDVHNVLDNPVRSEKMKNIFYWSKQLIQHRGTKSKLEFNTSNARTKDGKRSGA